MAEPYLKLQRQVSVYTENATYGQRIRVDVLEAEHVDRHIFRYLGAPINPREPTVLRGAFDGVCSPVDLEEMPVAAPTANANPAWCRLDFVDIVLRSSQDVDDLWVRLQEEVGNLVRTLIVMEDLRDSLTVEFGTPSDVSSSVEV